MIRYRDWTRRFNETVFQFGSPRYRGKDHTVVDTEDLEWVLKNVKNRALLSAEFAAEIRAELERRRRGTATPLRREEPLAPAPAPRPAARPVRPAQPKEEPRPVEQPKEPAARTWYRAKVISDKFGLKKGEMIAVSRDVENNEDWEYVTLKDRRRGHIPGDYIKEVATSEKGPDEKPIKTNNPEEWMEPEPEPIQQAPEPEPEPAAAEKKKQETTVAASKCKILTDKQMPPGSEQEGIDQQFAGMRSEGGHMMINALAGAGKTTMLLHLACKYGKPGERWLYLVFNKKNQVEAREKFPLKERGGWVEVYTTNSFCGNVVLKHENNLDRIPQTDWAAKIKGGKYDKRVDKVREIVDSPMFAGFKKKAGLPGSKEESKTLAEQHANDKYEKGALESILNQMQLTFQTAVVELTDKCKAFGVHPHKQATLTEEIDDVLKKYDIDVRMVEVKERITKGYDPSFSFRIRSALKRVLGYDLMSHDYTDPIKEATIWLLKETMPGVTGHTISRGPKGRETEYPLNAFRDFNDDLWYVATHAEELHFPKYDYVLADEVQDFNKARKVLIQKLAEQGAKIVAVGDPHQSIYRFAGADADAFNSLGTMLSEMSGGKDITKTLSKNFRSRRRILQHVNETMRDHLKGKELIAGKEFADGGEGVVTEDEMEYTDTFATLAKEWDKGKGKVKETAFIARTNDPLVEAALRLLAQGVPFIIVGREIAKELVEHLETVMNFAKPKLADSEPVSKLKSQMETHRESEQKRYGALSSRQVYLKEMNDTTNALVQAIDQFDPAPDPYEGGFRRGATRAPGKTIRQFLEWLKEKLGGFDVQENEADLAAFKKKVEEEHPVILTTAHKSKGLEFERVFILRDDLFPSPKAVKSGRPEELVQEENARYVAYTRAMDELHIVKLKGQPGYKEK
jgi:hypothetical protein